MAITRVSFPTVPNPIAGDWALAVELISKSFKNVNMPLQVINGVIPLGSTFQLGDVVYFADADEAIIGAESNYVKLIPSNDGLTLSAEYTATLTGVAWNKLYNGYYDITGNMYIFDEALAISNAAISVAYTRIGSTWQQLSNQVLNKNADVEFASVSTAQLSASLFTIEQTNITQDALFDVLDSYVPSVNDSCTITGSCVWNGYLGLLVYAVRLTTTSIRIYGAAALTNTSWVITKDNFNTIFTIICACGGLKI